MKSASIGVFVVLALALAVGLATAVSPFASASPDGLERVARDEGFLAAGKSHAVQDESPLPDYAFPWIDDARVATGLAGFTGTLVVFGLGWGVAALARRHRSPSAPTV